MSESTFRYCAERLTSRANVDYFLSYEMIMHAPRTAAYAPDFRHVRDGVVSVVMDRFLETYGAPTSAAPQGFTELGYLAANPDVESEVHAGLWDSGYQHYAARGRPEGRPLLPGDGPTARTIKAGAA
ncbi:GSCFA domain-containing protein [Chelatococcus sambhunathii]|uniref:GSCFA domain-containing protein n=1 Tax=Chelatococcus sambhunathii TaxID=363953 RepID=A0ABU1DC44_9HYPH|nr:GSCFA domain-containing protein [Chelatococcus sambhunathii]